MTAIANAAREAGHDVAFCAAGYLKATLESRGYRVYPIPAPTFFGLPTPISRLVEKHSQTATLPVQPGRDFGNIWFVLCLSGMTRPGYLNQVVAAELAAVRDFGATALFTDLDPGAFLLSQITGLPIGMAYQSPMAQGVGSFPWKWMNSVVNQVLRTHRLPTRPIEELFHGSNVLKLIPSIPELEEVASDRPDVCYLGSLIGTIQNSVSISIQTDKRYVFVYLGTGSVSLKLARIILPEVFPADRNQICLVGAQSMNQVERIENVEFHPFIPAEIILPHCDWTICHGGQNTITQSLQYGVPLLVFPGPIFERRYNSRKIQENFAGEMSELPDFNVNWLKSALLRRERYVQNARCLGQKMRVYGGAHAGVKALENWVNMR